MEEEKLSKRERKRLRREEKRQRQESEKKKSMTSKLISIAVVLIGVVFVWNLLTSGNSGDQTASDDTSTDIEVLSIKDTDHILGDSSSVVQIIEYGDYQCPACGQYHPITKAIVEKYGDQIAFVYRHFPIRNAHKHAQIAGQAAEAAGKQGKFWEMHDKLYDTQESWSRVRDPRSDFEGYASELGLDVEQFKADMNSDESKDIVDNDYTGGIKAGVNSTPSIYVNGGKLERPLALDEFSVLIDQIISTAEAENEDSTPSAEIQEE